MSDRGWGIQSEKSWLRQTASSMDPKRRKRFLDSYRKSLDLRYKDFNGKLELASTQLVAMVKEIRSLQ